MSDWRKAVHYPTDLKKNSSYLNFSVLREIFGFRVDCWSQVELKYVVCCCVHSHNTATEPVILIYTGIIILRPEKVNSQLLYLNANLT